MQSAGTQTLLLHGKSVTDFLKHPRFHIPLVLPHWAVTTRASLQLLEPAKHVLTSGPSNCLFLLLMRAGPTVTLRN